MVARVGILTCQGVWEYVKNTKEQIEQKELMTRIRLSQCSIKKRWQRSECQEITKKSKEKGAHEQRAQEPLVNKMEKSIDIGIGKEVTCATEISKTESSKEEV